MTFTPTPGSRPVAGLTSIASRVADLAPVRSRALAACRKHRRPGTHVCCNRGTWRFQVARRKRSLRSRADAADWMRRFPRPGSGFGGEAGNDRHNFRALAGGVPEQGQEFLVAGDLRRLGHESCTVRATQAGHTLLASSAIERDFR